jgi:hypothetical protein
VSSSAAVRRIDRESIEATWRVIGPHVRLLGGAYAPGAGERVGVIISGGNTTAVDFDR